jgi:hypothetical protein
MNFTIPDFDFTFENIVIRKANQTIATYLGVNAIVHGYVDNIKRIENTLSEQFWDLITPQDRLVYVREIMLHIVAIKNKYNEDINRSLPSNGILKNRMVDGLSEANNILDDLQYFLYGLLVKDGYNLDTNSFTFGETYDLNLKIDEILYKLDELKAGEEVLYNEFEEMKEKLKGDFESQKREYPLGKTKYFQLAIGKIASYAGNKVADEIFAALKPQILVFFALQYPHLLESVEKILLSK